MDNKEKPVVCVGMSGGVDSSAAAMLLKEQGFDVVGLYMRLWKEKDSGQRDSAAREEADARRVAEELGIRFKVIDVRRDFKRAIVDYFLSEYENGRTPNPCVRCNREIKFGILFGKAMELGADYFATGHYARIKKYTEIDDEGKRREIFRLLRARDTQKDQSYFLYNLDQKILRKTIFPLGEFTKLQVRELAREKKLSVHDKSDSQEVCFISDKYYGEFLRRMKVKMHPGEIVDEDGQVLGQHQGLPLYTIGQRRDIRIGGTGPYFVIGIDYKRNRLIVYRSTVHKKLFSRRFSLSEVNWTADKPDEFPLGVKVKTRYRMEGVAAKVDKEKGRYVVTLSKKSRAVMPGQSAVFYRRDYVLGGGVIDKISE